MFGKFIYEVSIQDKYIIDKNKEQLCKHFSNYTSKNDSLTKKNCAYNFSCLFDMFAVFADEKVGLINFG